MRFAIQNGSAAARPGLTVLGRLCGGCEDGDQLAGFAQERGDVVPGDELVLVDECAPEELPRDVLAAYVVGKITDEPLHGARERPEPLRNIIASHAQPIAVGHSRSGSC